MAFTPEPGLIMVTVSLRAVLDEHPERTEGWVLLARSQLELGRVADAAASFERALKLDPDQPGRTCILLASHEISRARGGPHCLTHPLLRDA